MSEEKERFYEFGNFRVDANERILFLDGEPLRLPPKTFDLLLAIVTNADRIIEKEQLMREVWADAFVEDANLTVHISALRKILDNGNGGARYIETVPKRGYRFTADVRETRKDKQTLADYIEELPSSGIETQIAQKNVEGDIAKTERIETAGEESAQSQIRSDSNTEKIFPVNKFKTIYALAAILIIIFTSGYFLNWRFNQHSLSSQKIKRIPGTEKSAAIAISPDGQYLAHAVSNAGKRSLHTLHIASNSSVQLLSPADILYTGLTFSNDGNYIYYTQDGKDGSELYKIPILGGDEKKILVNVSGKISFSPDGNQFVFIRKRGEKETALMIADANGGNERVVSAKNSPGFFAASDLSWSPDGKTIVCVKGLRKKDRLMQIVSINVESGEEYLFSDKKWHGTDGLAWLADGSGVIVSAFETGAAPTQIWILPYPMGEPYRITNDLNNYGSIGLTADSKTLLAGQFDVTSGIWLTSAGNPSQTKAIKRGKHDDFKFISWTSDNRILFGSSASGNRDIWIMNADGDNQKQLTANARENTQPTATFDNRYIVFSSDRAAEGTYNIWRMNIDGTNPVQLTDGNGEIQPVSTSDGKWVIYTSGGMETPVHRRTIWKVPIDGGEAVQLISNPSQWADVSPDGKTFACWYKLNESSPWKIAVVPLEVGQPVKILDVTPNSPIRWTPDGNAISYVKTIDAVSNVWSQPIGGGAPKQLTQFTAEQITNFDWSSDNQLICSRGVINRDTVLISNFR